MILSKPTTRDMVLSAMEQGVVYDIEDVKQAIARLYFESELPKIYHGRIYIVLNDKTMLPCLRRLKKGLYCLSETYKRVVKDPPVAENISATELKRRILETLRDYVVYDLKSIIFAVFNTKNYYLYTVKVNSALKQMLKEYRVVQLKNNKYVKCSQKQILAWFENLHTEDKHKIIANNDGLRKAFCEAHTEN